MHYRLMIIQAENSLGPCFGSLGFRTVAVRIHGNKPNFYRRIKRTIKSRKSIR